MKYINNLITEAALREKYLNRHIVQNGIVLKVNTVGSFGGQLHLGFVIDDSEVGGFINGWVHYQLAGEPLTARDHLDREIRAFAKREGIEIPRGCFAAVRAGLLEKFGKKEVAA